MDSKRLTEGKPLKTIFLFMLPILIGNIFQQLYGMVDAVIVGRTLGEVALGGLGASNAVVFLLVGFTFGLTCGFSVLIAQKFGANDAEGVKKATAQGFYLVIVFTVILTLIAVFTAKPLLRLIQTGDDIFPHAYAYVIVIYGGLGAAMFFNFFSNLLRSIGDSRTPLYFLIIASVLNIGLDYLFILVFHSGVEGAAYATIISQLVSVILSAVYTFVKYPVLRVRLSDFKPDFKILLKEVYLGIPMAFQFSLVSVGLIFVQAALNKLGTTYVVSFTAASKIDGVACQFMLATGVALAVYVGQNYGAKDYTRIKQGIKAGFLLAVIGSLICGALVISLSKPLVQLFIGAGRQEIYDLAFQYLCINGSMYFVLGLLGIYRNALQGVGKSLLVLIGGGVEFAVRMVVSILAMKYWGYMGICFASVLTWTGATVYLAIAYTVSMKKFYETAAVTA
ncbi:MAG: MATE family efflux transporter [Christensenellaceae bacterium]|nr:MATE family efflux transporter [Christensenellaceae bacterium]